MDRSRVRAPLLPLALAVLGGVLAGRSGIEVGGGHVLGLALCAAAASTRGSGAIAAFCALLACGTVGALRAQAPYGSVVASFPEGFSRYEGCVGIGSYSRDRRVWIGEIRVVPVEAGAPRIPARVRAVLPVSGRAGPDRGERIRLRGLTRRPNGPANPGERDQRQVDVDRGIAGRLRAAPDWQVVGRCRSGGGAVGRWIAAERERFGDLVVATLPAREAGLALAMTTGEKRRIDDLDAEAFRKTGTVHLLAISGLHLGLVVAVVYGVLRAALLRAVPSVAASRDLRPWAAAGAIGAASAYAVYAGFGIATARALVVSGLALGALACGARANGWNAWGAGMVAVLLLHPPSVASPSFALSFLAVGGILATLPGAPAVVENRLGRRARLKKYVVSAARVTAAASVATAPAVAWWFGRIPAAGLVANLVAVPLYGYGALLPLLAAAAVHPVSAPAARVLTFASWPALHIGRVVIGGIASLPFASVSFPCTGAGAVALGLAAGSALLLRGRRRVAFLLVALGLAFADGTRASRPPPGLEVTFLSVGQGDAAVVRFADGAVMVVDAGPPGAGARVVAPFLRSIGARKVDVLVLSHAHPDHFGGFEALAAALPVGEVWIGGPVAGDPLIRRSFDALARRGAGLRFVGSGMPPVRFGKATVEFLGGDGDRGVEWSYERESRNDRSVVLRVSDPGLSVLLTGDIEWAGELRLLETGGAIGSDVVKVPHHGSRTSSLEETVRAIAPRVAVVSAGRDNPYGFPHPEVVRRYVLVGSRTISTAEEGAVTVRACGAPRAGTLDESPVCVTSFFDSPSPER